MTKILMVCLGNICRSPLAEGIMRSKLDLSNFLVDSAGTGAYHVGELPDARSIEEARKNGINITNQRARQFKVSDFDNFDHIYVMDISNYQNVVKLARNDEDISKVALILDVLKDPKISEVPDPYYGGSDGFTRVFNLLNDATEIIEEQLQSK